MLKRKEFREKRLKEKAYQKMIKKNRKKIMRLAKDASTKPFDYELGLKMFVAYLEFMKDYYKLGAHVVAMELENSRPRLEGITDALECYELWHDVDDQITSKYFTDHNEPLDGKTYEEAQIGLDMELEYYKKRFFDILKDELETWWD